MMKYAINHEEEFETPLAAICIGLNSAVFTATLTLCCIIKMVSQDNIIDTLNSYVAFAAIVMAPNFAYLGLPVGHPMKAVSPDLKITNKKRTIRDRTCINWTYRIIYKILRLCYTSFWYYFLPLIPLILPLI